MTKVDAWYNIQSLCERCVNFKHLAMPAYPDECCGQLDGCVYSKTFIRYDYVEYGEDFPDFDDDCEYVGHFFGDTGSGVKTLYCKHFKLDYDAYLKSDLWKKNKTYALKRAGYKCQLCGSAMNLHVHHITYENLGMEEDEDLLVVCKKCHEKLHEKDIYNRRATNA